LSIHIAWPADVSSGGKKMENKILRTSFGGEKYYHKSK